MESLKGIEVSKDLLLDFFLTFSRFEYALKASGYAKAIRRGGLSIAAPDWDKYGKDINSSFNPSATPELQNAIQYLLDAPPREQVFLTDGGIRWEQTGLPHCDSEVETLLAVVRRVRNGLFHGGKFEVEFKSKERTEWLLRSSLLVLKTCLLLKDNVKGEFDDAVM